jgi:hypothetical protein
VRLLQKPNAEILVDKRQRLGPALVGRARRDLAARSDLAVFLRDFSRIGFRGRISMIADELVAPDIVLASHQVRDWA